MVYILLYGVLISLCNAFASYGEGLPKPHTLVLFALMHLNGYMINHVNPYNSSKLNMLQNKFGAPILLKFVSMSYVSLLLYVSIHYPHIIAHLLVV